MPYQRTLHNFLAPLKIFFIAITDAGLNQSKICLILTQLLNVIFHPFLCRFYTITATCYRRAMGIMLVYDVTSEKSFKGVASWISKIAENCDKNINKILLANKCDLKEKREITRERGEELAGRLGIPYVEISALSNLNVEEAFATLAKDIFNSLSHSGENGETENDFKPAKKSSCMSC